ncbi:MAG TPA: twin-arginine translocase subunit TatC [Capsulimonadaceae bacterium]|jgi:sec-independent protein translocase protein TatC
MIAKSSIIGDDDAVATVDEKRAELTEHLSELRSRIIRSFLYIVAGAMLVYGFYGPLFHAISYPLQAGLKEIGTHTANGMPFPAGTLVFPDFTAPFVLRIHLSMIGGLIAAVPFITLEVWGFVVPALTPRERKPFQLMAPFAIFLFVCGLALGFAIMPACVHWFLSFLDDYPNAILLQDPQNYILFLAKVLLAFGLLFQLPVILVALGKFGIVKSWMLTKYWRYIVVGITVLAMLVSPSADPTSMVVLAVPLVLLFFMSIALVKMVEPKE